MNKKTFEQKLEALASFPELKDTTVAKIGEVLDVPLARPRKRLELVSDPAYIKCRTAVLKFLYERHRYIEAA